jgi:hypothetical protein
VTDFALGIKFGGDDASRYALISHYVDSELLSAVMYILLYAHLHLSSWLPVLAIPGQTFYHIPTYSDPF